jgi:hypothetical protein
MERPTGFIGICQKCNVPIGAIDGRRTDSIEAGNIISKWLTEGRIVKPMFGSNWTVHIYSCQCKKRNRGETMKAYIIKYEGMYFTGDEKDSYGTLNNAKLYLSYKKANEVIVDYSLPLTSLVETVEVKKK